MLKPFDVVLVEHDPAWAGVAEGYAAGLRGAVSCLVEVHHIGSTSVAGLAAKPIIDLMPVATGLEALDRERGAVEGLGYGWHGEQGIAGRRYCTLDDGEGRRIVQLHWFAEGDPGVTRHLAFRDYLRAHAEVAAAYEAEKRRARDLWPGDSWGYCEEKAAWVRRVEGEALVWYGGVEITRDQQCL